jgi:hypothetical protein
VLVVYGPQCETRKFQEEFVVVAMIQEEHTGMRYGIMRSVNDGIMLVGMTKRMRSITTRRHESRQFASFTFARNFAESFVCVPPGTSQARNLSPYRIVPTR